MAVLNKKQPVHYPVLEWLASFLTHRPGRKIKICSCLLPIYTGFG